MSDDHPDGALTPGARVGPYEVTARIGGGGMGEVFRARDTRLGRDVALKVLPSAFASDPERLRRFDQEARAAGTLDHPGILVVHEFGSHEGRPYLATELLEGESLRERLSAGALPVRKAVELAVQIARALDAAHARGIVHRDLKPDNLFLTRDGRAKILDFGLAKLTAAAPLGIDGETDTEASPNTSPGALIGTVGYLSPEQARGRPADSRSDIFALGLVLYEMLTGARAFARGSAVETLNAILKEDAPEVTTVAGRTPAALDRIVRRCLEKDPDERFQSARDLAYALEAIGATSISGSDGLPVPDAAGQRPRRRSMMGPAGVVLGAVAAVGALYVLRPGPPRIVGSRPLVSALPGSPVSWATDGERVYFSVLEGGRYKAYQVALAGGEPAPITVPFEHAIVLDASARRSALLVKGWNGNVDAPIEQYLPLWIAPVPAGPPRRPGPDVVAAAWSPDGEAIAYAGRPSDARLEFPRPAVYVADGNGAGARKLWEQADAGAFDVYWSPGGRGITFLTNDRSSGEWAVLEMPRDGGTTREIPVGGSAGRWTPDGRFFLFEGRGQSLYAARTPGLRTLWRGRPPTQLTFGPMSFDGPLFTPDGRHAIARGTLRRSELQRYDDRSRAFERVRGVPGGVVDYSADGRWVAWVDPANLTLWRARTDGSDRLQLTVPPLRVGLARWSPDATQLTFVGFAQGVGVPYVVPRDGGVARALVEPGRLSAWDVCWLPDGKTVVWGYLNDPRAPISRHDLDSHTTTVIPGSEGMEGPKCSRQGAILAAKEWSSNWWVYRPDGRWEDLGPQTAAYHLAYASWSADGGSIYGLSLDRRSIERYSLGARRLEKVTDLGAVSPAAPVLFTPWMGLDDRDRPLVVHGTGVEDLYVLDWEAP